jgi:Ca2+-binding EF-hand superfamily protein
MFDKNRDGNLQISEMDRAFNSMGIVTNKAENEVLYMFLDLDGSGNIDYREFIRKLRRSGVAVRSKEEEIINRLWNSITKSNLTLEQAFKVFDKDNDNLISYDDMVNAMNSLSMKVEPKVISELFRMSDVTGDGKISNSEFVYIFKKFNKVSYERSEDTHLDWKYDVMAKLDKVSKSKDISLEEIFNSLDTDLDGKIAVNELNELFETLGVRLESKEFEKLFYAIDTNRSGFIGFTEFLAYVNRSKRESERVHRAKIIQTRKRQNMSESSLGLDGDATADPTTKYQLKVSLLEAKEKSAQRQLQKMALKLDQLEEQLKKEEHTVRSLEDANIRTKKEYFEEK